jgi:hypothetical protein
MGLPDRNLFYNIFCNKSISEKTYLKATAKQNHKTKSDVLDFFLTPAQIKPKARAKTIKDKSKRKKMISLSILPHPFS